MTMTGAPGAGVDFSAEISATLGRISKRLDDDAARAIRLREIERARQPQNVRLQGSGVCPTPTTPFGINFGGPDPGFYWNVRRIIVGGLTWTTTAAGSVEVYVTGLAGAQGVPSSGAGSVASIRSLSDLVDQNATMPTKGFYGVGELSVLANESLVVVVNTGTAGQQYSASALIQLVRTATDRDSEFSV